MKRLIGLAALSLGLSLPAAPQATLEDGFSVAGLPNPVFGARSKTLPNGDFVTFDGQSIDRWNADGSFDLNILTLPTPDTAGAFAIAPGETFGVAGQVGTGNLIKFDPYLGGGIVLTNIPGSYDAAFQNPTTFFVSADVCGGCNTTDLIKVDGNTGDQTLMTIMSGQPGPVACNAAGDLFYGRNSSSLPTPTGSGDLVRFDASQLAPPPATIYQMESDLVVFEIESHPVVQGWSEETTWTGFTGDSYYRWSFPDNNTPGLGIMTWQFYVPEDTNYQLRIHNRHNHPNTSLENDCWTSMDSAPWVKTFSNIAGSSGVWNWSSKTEPDHVEANFDLTPGVHELRISGRSKNFMIDRVHIWKTGLQGAQLFHPQSRQVGLVETDATVVSTGHDHITSLAIDYSYGSIFVAENDQNAGTNSITRLGNDFLAPQVLLAGSNGRWLTDLELIPPTGAAFFFPYQPLKGGSLKYRSRDFPTPVSSESYVRMSPKRPVLSFSGPGTVSGNGMVELKVVDSDPFDVIWILLGPFSDFALPEVTGFIDGYPLVQTGLNPFTLFPGNLIFLADANGDFTLNFNYTVGITGAIVAQGLLFHNPSFKILGMTTPQIL